MERREQQGKQAAQGRLVHGEILVLLASLGHQERERMGSRDYEDHLDYLVP